MSITTDDPTAEEAVAPGDLHDRLDTLHDEVRRQAGSIRATQRAFSMFAGVALVVALATLLVVAAKLQAKPSVRVTAPAKSARASGSTGVSGSTGAAAAPSAAPLGHTVKAGLTEMKITSDVTSVASGRVTFTVHNAGTVEHEFVILRTSQLASKLPMSGGRASEAGHTGEISSLKPGQTKTLTLTLKPGHYSLICNLPGHYTGGMHADLTVK